jgi:hypothetical protein
LHDNKLGTWLLVEMPDKHASPKAVTAGGRHGRHSRHGREGRGPFVN